MVYYPQDYPTARISDPPAPVLKNPVSANPFPLPPRRPPNFGVNQPDQAVQASTPTGGIFDFLRTLFGGQQVSPQGQGMTGLLTPRGQAGAGTNMLGNPFNRFG
jgi:hypothetical protein